MYLVKGDGEVLERAVPADDAHGDQAVMALRWCSSASAWVVGRRSGLVQLLAGATLKTLSEIDIGTGIWCLNAADAASGPAILVGGDAPEIWQLAINPKIAAMRRVRTIRVPAFSNPSPAIHAVRFLADGEQAYAIDSNGRMMQCSFAARGR